MDDTHTKGVVRFSLSDMYNNDILEADIHLNRTLIKIVDVLGRETNVQPNIPQLYLYDDGSVEKKVIVQHR